jgi:hypothetical protein
MDFLGVVNPNMSDFIGLFALHGFHALPSGARCGQHNELILLGDFAGKMPMCKGVCKKMPFLALS